MHQKLVNVGVNVDMVFPFPVTRQTIERWLKHSKDSQQMECRGAPKNLLLIAQRLLASGIRVVQAAELARH